MVKKSTSLLHIPVPAKVGFTVLAIAFMVYGAFLAGEYNANNQPQSLQTHAAGVTPSGQYYIYPVGGTKPQTNKVYITYDPSHYSFRAFATCTNGVGGSSHKTIFGSWKSGSGYASQTPYCNTVYSNGVVNTAGFQYDKTKQFPVVCYTYGQFDHSTCQ
jgi:hypothetical protein